MPTYEEKSQPCLDCGTNTFWHCAGCAKCDGRGARSGYYCVTKGRNCFKLVHERKARTRAE